MINKAIIVIICAVLLYVGIALYSDFSSFYKEIQHVNLQLLPLILSFIFLSLFLKVLRQSFMLKSLGIKIPFLYSFKLSIAGLSMLFTPAGTGTIIKSHFLKTNYNESRSKTIPFVLVERYHEFVAIVIILLITLVFNNAIETKIVAFFSAALLITCFIIIRKNGILIAIQKKIEKIKFLKNLFQKDKEFYDSLSILFNSKIALILMTFTTLIIFTESLGVYFAFLSLLPGIDYMKSIQIFYTSVLAGLFSLIPAGLGVTEVSMIDLFTKSHIDISKAVTAVLYSRLATLWFMTALGFIFLKTMNLSKKNNLSKEES